MTPEESASKLLKVFKDRNIKVGERLIFNTLIGEFLKNSDIADFQSGIAWAFEQGLIEIREKRPIPIDYFLTEAGYKYIYNID